MDTEEIKRRLNRRIDTDAAFAANIGAALDAEDDYWLMQLIGEVIGFIIEIGSSIWNWIRDQFS